MRVAAWAAAVVLLLGGCAGAAKTSDERDELCPQLTAFANADPTGARHSVRLGNDWGGQFAPRENPDDFVMAYKTCDHDGYSPGKTLCDYLMENTSTEFPVINMRRAMSCFGMHAAGLSPTDDDKVPSKARSRRIEGNRLNSPIEVDLAHSTDEHPSVLTIIVGR